MEKVVWLTNQRGRSMPSPPAPNLSHCFGHNYLTDRKECKSRTQDGTELQQSSRGITGR